MKRLGFLLSIVFLLGISSVPILAGLKVASSEAFFVSLPEAGKISIQIPAKWQHSVVQPEAAKPATATIKITAPDDFPLQLSITIFDMSNPLNEEGRKTLVEKTLTESLEPLAKDSVEKKVNPRPLPTKLGAGAYAVITDASLVGKDPLPKDNFLKATSGHIISGKCVVVFMVLSNETESEQYREAMKIVTEGLTGEE
jgi:hypothetical protein